ncbi:protein NO VEIN domain-containing protein [Dactylosporangium sp. CS-033363]|uniref:protein NO VEIN domain-containing protein n=1 Tax=Dactylosporangium sp. CS-033363 TaxID=3239935 RepID=UPI003D91FFA1
MRAAERWLRHLPASGVSRCRTLFATHGSFSDLTPTQYDAALAWLRESGLLDDLNSAVPAAHRVFSAAIACSGTAWFADADVLVQGPAELPGDALRAAEVLGLDDREAYNQIVVAWGKVDTAERELIGASGEQALAELLTGGTDAHVDHVALRSDGYGYDIAVDGPGLGAHLEVKTTYRRERLVVFLSRNEYETMLRDLQWELVAVRLTAELTVAAVATIRRDWVAEQVPADTTAYGRWQSCRLTVPPSALSAGIPALGPLLRRDASPLIRGTAFW